MKKDLLTLLAELAANVSDEERERIRAEIQQLYQYSDSRVNVLVRNHRENISQGLQSCSQIICTISESKKRCQALKERISSCMSMLQVNRDNIRRMWLESLQHKYAHRILSEIEELRKIPRIVDDSLMNKKLEHATDVVVNSVKVLDRIDCNADALQDLKLELHNMQEKLYIMLLEDLRRHVHLKDLLDRFSECTDNVTYDDIFTNKIPKSHFYFKDVLAQASFVKPHVQVLLNCVATMQRLPETISFLKDVCQEDMVSMAAQVSKFMSEVIHNSIDVSVFDLPSQKQHIFLIDLVESVFCVFMKVAEHYKSFVEILVSTVECRGLAEIEFPYADVYSKMLVAVENFLGHYFDPLASATCSKESLALDSAHNVVNIGLYFSPQNQVEDSATNLFKFTHSFHGITRKMYSRESKILYGENPVEAEEMVLVCKPALKNVTLIFKVLKNFIVEVEQVFSVEDIDSTPLFSFMCDFTNLYLDQVNVDIMKMLQNVSANLEAWNKSPLGDCSSFRVGSEKQILSCSSMLENILKELKNLMTCLPDYSNHFLRLTYFVILDYKDVYNKVFRQLFEDELNFLSVSWARDRDIRRFMKTFLNWRHLEDDEVPEIFESPEDIRARNQQESELLIRNLQSEEELSWHIITDMDKLSNLALLQENILWFSHQLHKFTKHFARPDQSPTEDAMSKPDGGIRKIIKEYEDFADTCLLALHLEVRARCFHYLLPLSSHDHRLESDFLQELDVAVKHLTSDLLKIDEVLLPVLSPKEFKYVFEGLGELAASLVVLIASNIRKASDCVVLRLDRNISAIQCCLANITMSRESALEGARHFIDLLKSTPEEILNHIVEEGPRFNEVEYASALRLVTAGEASGTDYYEEKLRSIFRRLATSVSSPKD